jgi:hypothetical protein
MTADQMPGTDEYAPFYADYIQRVAREPDILARLARQLESSGGGFAALTDPTALSRYAAGKWSVKEIVSHLSDAERILAYRALRIARGDETPLAGFDEDAYVPAAEADRRSVADLASEWTAVRSATIALFRGLPDAAWVCRGTANGVRFSVRALARIIAGHELHHLETLRVRYGVEVSGL